MSRFQRMEIRMGKGIITSQNITLNKVILNYSKRNVTYLQGTNDVCNSKVNNTCDDHDMDTSCGGMFQGTYRLERGMHYLRSLQVFYGTFIHRISLVPFVGHDDEDMFQHPNGSRAIF